MYVTDDCSVNVKASLKIPVSIFVILIFSASGLFLMEQSRDWEEYHVSLLHWDVILPRLIHQ